MGEFRFVLFEAKKNYTRHFFKIYILHFVFFKLNNTQQINDTFPETKVRVRKNVGVVYFFSSLISDATLGRVAPAPLRLQGAASPLGETPVCKYYAFRDKTAVVESRHLCTSVKRTGIVKFQCKYLSQEQDGQ